jgi:hypothetical protein
MKYILYVNTDDDFSLKYKDKYHHNDIVIYVSDPEELKNIEILGAFGTKLTERTKCLEYKLAVEQILKNPNKIYRQVGGNREIEWFPISGKNKIVDVHTQHCCSVHNYCKYGQETNGCTVVDLGVSPDYPCNCEY